MGKLDDIINEQFKAWEKPGRGWKVWPHPVMPEPPFRPFRGYTLPPTNPEVDDGRKPTLFASLFSKAEKALNPKPSLVPEPENEEPEPTPLIRDALIEFQAALPASLDIAPDRFDHFFRSLSLCHEPMAFELVGVHGRVFAQFAVSAADAPLARKQLNAYFPDVLFREQENALENAFIRSEGDEVYAVEFGLEREFMLPLASGKLDPFIGLVGALSELGPGEFALYQILWQPLEPAWATSVLNAVSHLDGKPFFVNFPELMRGAEEKVSQPLYATVVRMLLRTSNESRLHDLGRNLAGSLRVFANAEGNALIPLHNEDYPFAEHVEDVLRRQTRRTGMVLNGDELAGFVHLPGSDVRSPVFQRDAGVTKAAPSIVTDPQGIYLGDNEHNGEIVPVYLSTDQRVRHSHIIGASGTGKSSLLLNLIRQDIERGEGVAVLDPHGDLIDLILGIIPENRIDDVVLVNPSDADFPVGFNILLAHSEEEKTLLASDLIAVFRRLSTSWGDQMDAVLQNSILAFLESTKGGTLADLRRFLLEPAFRAEFLQSVKDPELIYYWQKVFPHLTGGKSIGPVLTRLQDFFSRKPLRNMVAQAENKLDFGHIMDTGKIFLARLSEGLLGRENSYLLGTLLISKFQQLTMARQAQSVSTRRDFWIYIDEFHHFITPSMAQILQGTRKYRIGLTLAHHELKQLHRDTEVESAVMSHPCTRVVFQVGDEDAKRLADCFESFEAKSLKTLEKYHGIARVERNDFDFNLSFPRPCLPDKEEAVKRATQVIAASRSKYATARAEVEAALLRNLKGGDPKAGHSAPPAPLPKLPEPPKPAPSPAVASVPNIANLSTVLENKEAVANSSKAPTEPKDLGRGGPQHQAIQERLKSEAHKCGFLAEVEKQLKKGSNEAADLVLQLGELSIAVEIAVTTTVSHEFENVRKCLDTGFERIAVVSTNRKRLEEIAAAVQGGLGSDAAAKVAYYTPDELIAEFQRFVKEAKPGPALPAGERKSHGRTIRRHLPTLAPGEVKQKDDALRRIILDTMRPPKQP